MERIVSDGDLTMGDLSVKGLDFAEVGCPRRAGILLQCEILLKRMAVKLFLPLFGGIDDNAYEGKITYALFIESLLGDDVLGHRRFVPLAMCHPLILICHHNFTPRLSTMDWIVRPFPKFHLE